MFRRGSKIQAKGPDGDDTGNCKGIGILFVGTSKADVHPMVNA